MHNFKDSLVKGKKGEDLFLEFYKDKIEHLDGRRNDFKVLSTGELIELKTDYYDMTKTPNFFMERWSDSENRKMGGPWQATVNGNTWYIYFFVQNGVMFKFQTLPLIAALRPMEKELPLINIKNKSWTTQGYLVERESLSKIYKKIIL